LSNAKYIIGIDLGTTHCILAYTENRPTDEGPVEIHTFPILQITDSGEVAGRHLLPSFIFIPGPHDVPEGGIALPWDPHAEIAVGEYARKRGAEIPNRLVSSAKSWLSFSGVDRTAPILPWDSPAEARRISPVESSAKLLEHMREAWNFEMAANNPEARLEAQDVYLTVPASFDAVARELTVKAAQTAGLLNITLIEEPQAAFYSWIEDRGDRWRKEVRVGESILVCDVGGGTTDFSLIQVTEEDGELTLRRVAVGEHILLGGDNMDLTLAYAIQAKLAQKGTKIDSWQFRGLWHSCRVAKERLLANPEIEAEPVVVLGRGSSLIGGTIRTELLQSELQSIILDGFFPVIESNEYPKEKPKVGMREMGLPYEADPAATRHLARFLGQQAQIGGDESPAGDISFPSAVLFNGGVMKSGLIRNRLRKVLNKWRGADEVRELESSDLDLAVGRGAAYYGLARHGRGIRIRGGVARPYYIAVESAMPAVPGIPTPLKALCVVPFGMEEGTEAEIREKEFGLVVGEPAVFHLLASTTRRNDRIGEIVEDWQGEIAEVTTMETALTAADEQEGGGIIPVWLQTRVTEIGTLELWCVARDEDRRWKLEFNLREHQEVQ
jgi:molecular chaperone DnaK (HSP70)